jgi:putative nucleotidyltransferase with HDIG domain
MQIATIQRRLADRYARAGDMRWPILIAVTVIFAAMLYPGFAIHVHDYRLGDVAERNIKATRDFLVEDPSATETSRNEAVEAVLSVYDHDPALPKTLGQKIDKAFAEMRTALEVAQTAAPELATVPGPEIPRDPGQPNQPTPAPVLPPPTAPASPSLEEILASKRPAFEAAVGAPIDAATYRMLARFGFNRTLADRITRILNEILSNGVVANKEILLRESDRGITLRTVPGGREITVRNFRQFYGLDEAKTMVRVIGQPILRDYGAADYQLIVDLTQNLLQPNITPNRNETQERKAAAESAVKPVFQKIKAGEMLLREGERVTAFKLLKLKMLQEEQQGTQILLRSIGAALILAALLMAAFVLYHQRAGGERQLGRRDLLFIAVVLCTFFAVAEVSASLAQTLEQNTAFSFRAISVFYATPIAAAPMLICLFLGLSAAMPLAVILGVCVAIVDQDTFVVFLYFFVSGAMGAYWIRYCRERKVFIKAGAKLGLLHMGLVTAIAVYGGRLSLPTLAWEWALSFLGGIGCGVVASGLVPLVEIIFGYTSDIKLLELANLDQPLMRQLMIEAPGTYHHSVIVGNLVEAAASETGANPLLAKVCGYYHDIGKVKKPEYFIENQAGGRNRHDRLAPSMSALILIAHIKDGLELARRHKLGPDIADTIQQHHGTSLIRYFYEKAKQLKGAEAVNIDNYRYPGPKPQTREAGLVMLADVVEAASRTLENPTPARIQGLVQNLINNIFSDGQLDNCELTLRDLHKIAKSFNKILNGIHHHRIEYPESRTAANGKGRARDGNPDRQPAKTTTDRPDEGPEGGERHLKRLGLS